jgi:hypothetical protein
VAAAAPTQKLTLGTSGTDGAPRGTTTSSSPAYSPTATVSGPSGGPPPVTAPTAVSDSSEKGTTKTAASDGAVSSKSSPVPQSASADRQSVEQRLYLDPATVAELRQALGAGGAPLDPEALDRGAATLRARAHTLRAQAQALHTRSRTP